MQSRLDHHLHALREPTKAQKEAGNYPKRRVIFAGLPVSIENPRGSVRRGRDRGGKEWAVAMAHDYGYIRGTLGVDGDHFDVLLGMNEAAPTVYLATTKAPPAFTADDEQKALIGFSSEEEARAAFLGMYDDPRFLGELRAMPLEEFREKVMTTRAAPRLLKARVLFLKAQIPGGAHADLFAQTVTVQGHTRGATYVAPYQARRVKHAMTGREVPPDLLTADRATYERAIYDAAMARLDAGKPVTVATSLRVTHIGPQHRDVLRFEGGKVQMQEGRNWITLGPIGQAIDSLAGGLGLPTSYQRSAARAEHDAAHPEERDARIAAAAADMEPLLAERDRIRAMEDSHEKDSAHKDVDRRIHAKARSLGVFASDVEEWRDEHAPPAPAAREADETWSRDALAKEGEYWGPRRMTEPRAMFRSVSLAELADIAARGSVTGRGNTFSESGPNARRHVFWGEEATPYIIGQGEQLERQAFVALADSPELKAVIEATAAADAAQAENIKASTAYSALWKLDAGSRQKAAAGAKADAAREKARVARVALEEAKKAWRAANGAWVAKRKGELVSMPYTSAVIETHPVGGGLRYSKEYGSSGASEPEYGFPSGFVRAEDIARVHLVKDGKIVATMPLADAARAASPPPPAALPARDQLDRLRQRIDQTGKEIATRIGAMSGQAEGYARAIEPGRGKWFGRGTTTWTKRQERWFQDHLSDLIGGEAASLRAALSRYDRLMAQEAADSKRLGVNEPWRPDSHAAAAIAMARPHLAGTPAAPEKPANPADLAKKEYKLRQEIEKLTTGMIPPPGSPEGIKRVTRLAKVQAQHAAVKFDLDAAREAAPAPKAVFIIGGRR